MMDAAALQAALEAHWGQAAQPLGAGRLRFRLAEGDWWLALCPAAETAAEYLSAFEAGMQALLQAAPGAGDRPGLALDAGALLAGRRPSYRAALKKYSNSIVFEDVGISLHLVGPQGLYSLAPAEVNAFLRDLDRQLKQL